MKAQEHCLGPDDQGRRLDRLIRIFRPDLSLSAIYRLLRTGDIRLNGKRVKPEQRVTAGDRLEFRGPLALQATGESGQEAAARVARPGLQAASKAAATLAALLIYEDEDLLFVNKPRGMLSHGPGGLDELAQSYLAPRLGASLAFRPAPLHRLDRNTSGILTISASLRGAQDFSAALRAGQVTKTYLALLDGKLPGPQDWQDRLSRDRVRRLSSVHPSAAGKPGDEEAAARRDEPGNPDHGQVARSRIWPLDHASGYSLVALRLETGRTHQIRSQCAAHGWPLAGDNKYGGSRLAGGYLLHAASLGLPDGRQLNAPLPAAAEARLVAIFGEKTIESLSFLLDSLP